MDTIHLCVCVSFNHNLISLIIIVGENVCYNGPRSKKWSGLNCARAQNYSECVGPGRARTQGARAPVGSGLIIWARSKL